MSGRPDAEAIDRQRVAAALVASATGAFLGMLIASRSVPLALLAGATVGTLVSLYAHIWARRGLHPPSSRTLALLAGSGWSWVIVALVIRLLGRGEVRLDLKVLFAIAIATIFTALYVATRGSDQ